MLYSPTRTIVGSQIRKTRRSLIALISMLALLLISLIPMRAPLLATARATERVAVMDSQETFVFQVGIDKYTSPKVPRLDGCVRDVLEMKKLLIKKFNVPAGHFLTLTDQQATHEAIIAGFRKELIDNARSHRGAIVIFQYSGHGSQVKDRTGNKANGLDSTLVPVNSRDLKGSYFDIVDDEIRELFEELSQYTANITFIIDACHSGNPTRGAGKTRGIEEDTRPQPAQRPKPGVEPSGPKLVGGDLSAMLPRDQHYVAIAATLPHELANEKSFPELNQANGALTFYLLKALERARPETTYRQLMAEVANAVTADYAGQHPQVEGDIGRPVFGGSANREDPFIEISDAKSDVLTVKAGSAQGLAAGTVINVYAPDAIHLSGVEKRLATGTVTNVMPFTSTVKLDTTNPIPAGAKVVIVSPDFGSLRTRVALAREMITRGASPAAEMKASLTSLLERSTSIALVGEVNLEAAGLRGINWDVIVKQVKFSDWFHEGDTASGNLATPRLPDRQVYCLTGADGTRPLFDFFVEIDDPLAAQKIAVALGRLANQRSLRAVVNETSQLTGSLKINVLRVTGDLEAIPPKVEKEEVVTLPADATDYHFNEGEFIRLEIENLSDSDLYVTIFDISTDGSIQILFPPPGATVAIPKGGKVKPPFNLKLGGPAGYETYKAIASTDKHGASDFAFLAQSGVTRNSARVSLVNLPDWTTAQVNVWINEKPR